jgi:hypothetical protein
MCPPPRREWREDRDSSLSFGEVVARDMLSNTQTTRVSFTLRVELIE